MRFDRIKTTIQAIALILLASVSFAQTYHVRPGASGNGNDWSNPLGSLPAALQRGATYYLADGSYPGRTFNDNESGSAYITIRKATEAEHGASTGWQSDYGDGQAVFGSRLTFKSDYYILDGMTRNESNWRDGAAYGFRIRFSPGKGSDGIVIDYNYQVGFITIRNCHIAADSINSPGDRAIESLWDTHDITIENNYMTNCAVPVILRRCRNVTWSGCWVGPNNLATSGQHIEVLSNYETDNLTITGNVFANIGNTGFLMTGNGWNDSLGDGCHNWVIENNVFVYLPNGGPQWGTGHGALGNLHDEPINGLSFRNNSLINMQGWRTGPYFEGPVYDYTAENNLYYLQGQDPDGGGTLITVPSGAGNLYWEGSDPFVDWRNGNFALKPGHALNTAGKNGSAVGAAWGGEVPGPIETPEPIETPVPTPKPTPAPTPEPGTETLYEAEFARLSGGAEPQTTHGEFSGEGYVNFPASGGRLEVIHTAGSAGRVFLSIHYGLKYGPRTGLLEVNGVAETLTMIDENNDWLNRVTMEVPIELVAGENTIALVTTGEDFGNVDWLKVAEPAAQPTPEPTPEPTPTPEPEPTPDPCLDLQAMLADALEANRKLTADLVATQKERDEAIQFALDVIELSRSGFEEIRATVIKSLESLNQPEASQ